MGCLQLQQLPKQLHQLWVAGTGLLILDIV